MTGAMIGLLAGVALALWVIRRVTIARRPAAQDEIDHAELEAAEREVRDYDTLAQPDDDHPASDWGPGAGR